MIDDATKHELEIAAGWNPPAGECGACGGPSEAVGYCPACGSYGDCPPPAPPAVPVWRAEPPDRPGWWWCDPVPEAATVARVVRVDYLDSYRSFPEARWAGPIPEPTDAPDPLDLVVEAIGPDEALAVAAEALRASGDEGAARVVEMLAARLGDREALAHARLVLCSPTETGL